MDLIPMIATEFGIAPSSLLFYLAIVTTLANVTARLIPNDAVGWRGTVRTLASVLGVYVSSRVSRGVTVNDVAAAALTTPPIDRKAEAEAGKA